LWVVLLMVLWENEPNGAKIIDRTLNLGSEKVSCQLQRC
jgi:hypothetical protein